MLVNYVTGIYKRSKPWAEISDKSCMRSGCHETRMLEGKVKFKKNIHFDHGPHLREMRRGKKLRCTSCHSQIVQGSHISVTEDTCFLCHFKDADGEASLRTCTKCHEPPVPQTGKLVSFNHQMVIEKKLECQKCHGHMQVGDGAVPRSRCSSCHADVDKIKLYDDSALMHRNHITDHKIECRQCHLPIRHFSVSRSEAVRPDCRSCHPEFHSAQLYLFSGQKGIGVPEQPAPMFLAGLNCRACHTHLTFADGFKPKGETVSATAEACVQCHGNGYDKILADWLRQSQTQLTHLTRILAQAEKIVESRKKHSAYAAARKLLDDANYNYNLVKHGVAVHNMTFSFRLLDSAYQGAQKGLKLLGVSQQLPAFHAVTKLVPGECVSCHTGIERKTVTVFGWRFSHFLHLKGQELDCKRCHSMDDKTRHGRLVIDKQGCMNCHHQEKGAADAGEEGCKKCHRIQSAIYSSKLSFSTLAVPNMMIKDVSCTDCHKDDQGRLLRSGKEVCSKCHEKDYEEMFTEWQSDAGELLKRLKEKVEKNKLKKGDPAYDLLLLLQRDGSKGIHNPELVEKLVEEGLNQ